MKSWKRALVAGALGAGAVLLLRGRRSAAMAAAGIGVAVLAAEYPGEIERFCDEAEDYVYKGTLVVNLLTRVVERFAERREPAEEGSRYLT
jgi:hypothetical protein